MRRTCVALITGLLAEVESDSWVYGRDGGRGGSDGSRGSAGNEEKSQGEQSILRSAC